MENKNDYPVPGEFDVSNVVSTNECTGLVQGLPEDDEQIENYTDICDIPEQEALGAFINEQEDLIRRQKA